MHVCVRVCVCVHEPTFKRLWFYCLAIYHGWYRAQAGLPYISNGFVSVSVDSTKVTAAALFFTDLDKILHIDLNRNLGLVHMQTNLSLQVICQIHDKSSKSQHMLSLLLYISFFRNVYFIGWYLTYRVLPKVTHNQQLPQIALIQQIFLFRPLCL